MATKAYAICKETKGKRDVYTANETDTLLSGKANAEHNHDGWYYRRENIDSMMNSVAADIDTKADSDHTHDNRYYTETEINNKLAGKSDTSHNHDSRYYTESEVNNMFGDLLITKSFNISKTELGNARFNVALSGYTALGIIGYTGNSNEYPYYVGMVDATTALLQYDTSVTSGRSVTILYVKNLAA